MPVARSARCQCFSTKRSSSSGRPAWFVKKKESSVRYRGVGMARRTATISGRRGMVRALRAVFGGLSSPRVRDRRTDNLPSRKGKRVASNCLLAADDRFVVAFAKAELKGGCATTRDQAAVEDQVDRFVTGLLDTLTGGD